ncbi:MAG: ATP-binding protein [Lachnospiraceae bacterium]|nr:ATP-binding protein [Lachnospiraceae bacterium]
MYLKRKIDDFLLAWKADPERNPLLIKGARQVGKTESIKQFADHNYSNCVYINFALEKKYMTIADEGYDVDTVIKHISLINPQFGFPEKDTLIVFDEIQEYPDIATTLKSFKLDGRFDVICSGSMLGINHKKIHSNSVGYKTDHEMYSMDFEEFLWAKGYSDEQIKEIPGHMIDNRPFSSTEMSVFKALFLDYCVLGGMPAVVSRYINTGLFTGIPDIQAQIRLDYEEDVRKYAEGLDQTKILSVYRSIPAQLAKENKKYQFNKIAPNARSREYSGCIEWLIDAGVVSECNCLMYPELPFKGNADMSKFKLYYPDTGLLVSALDDEAQEDLRSNKNLGVYKGALYENFVAEAFLKQGLGLYYYKKENSTLEEDFFVRTGNELIPVEVKSNDHASRSLSALIKNEKYSDIKRGIKLGDLNTCNSGSIISFPYFCAFMIKEYLRSLG